MSLTDNLSIRLGYAGGAKQQTRMIEDKLRSLKKALIYSYQSGTIVLEDGREFRGLINPDKLKNDYDHKILSIPYKDICLNKEQVDNETTIQGQEEIGLSGGSVFKWKETDSYWIIFLQHLEEQAYFRAEIRRCRYEVVINDHVYKIYVRGPVETTIPWNQKKQITWNNMNNSLFAYITKNEETLDYFHRFAKVEIDGKPWEVKAKDSFAGDGIIELSLTEAYTNPLEDEYLPKFEEVENDPSAAYIEGNNNIYPYDVETYTINNTIGGEWSLDTNKVKIIEETETSVTIEVLTGKTLDFNLIYRREDSDDIILPIRVLSL